MKKFLLLFFIFKLFLLADEPAKGVIEGKVIDLASGSKIPGAIVKIYNSDYSTTCDSNGNFLFSNLPQHNSYNLIISAPYYTTIYKPGVAANSNKVLIIELRQTNYELDEVEIKSQKYFNKFENLNISSNYFSADEIKNEPGTAEDLNRMMMNLPGVSTATDSRNDLIVRGGNPSENLLMIDGIEIPNSNHYGTQGASGGAFGMINTDFLKDVSFSTGGFPAKYGNRLSSFMNVQYRKGNKEKITGKINVGLSGAGFLVEGPIQKDKSSFIFSAKKSYLNLILPLTSITVIPSYSDFNLKATYEFSLNNRIELLGLGGTDQIEYSGFQNDDNIFIQNTKYSGWQGIVGLVDKWLAGDNTFIQSSLSTNFFRKDMDSHFLGRQTFNNNSLEREFVLRSDITQTLSNSDLLEAGIISKYLDNSYLFFRGKKKDEFGNLINSFKYTGITTALKIGSYLQYTKYFSSKLNLTFSIRQDYFNAIKTPNTFSPRSSLSYSLLDNFKINFAYGVYHQDPPLLWLVADNRNRNLKQMKTNQFIAGFEYFLSNDIKMTVEYFNKQYSDYAASDAYPKVSYANEGVDYHTSGLEYLVPLSRGSAKGIEFFINKKLINNFYGTLSYSYSRIMFSGLDGVERPGSFDYKNLFTILFGYKFSKNFELSGKWKYMGGGPYTPFNLQLSSKLNQTILDYNKYNDLRFPAYQRLDLRIDYTIEFTSWDLVTFLDIQNVLNKENVDQIVWNQRKNEADKILQLKFLPVFGIKVELNKSTD